MLKRLFTSQKYKPLLIFFAAGWLISIAGLILFPSWRTGPFGIGLPSHMQTYIGQHTKFSIEYPESWVASETPTGNHGDSEVIAGIYVPGRGFPHVLIARRTYFGGDISAITAWGNDRVKDKANYATVSLDAFTTSNFAGSLREYHFESEPSLFGIIPIHCYDWYILNNTVGYAASFCSEQKHWAEVSPLFQHMIESFTLK